MKAAALILLLAAGCVAPRTDVETTDRVTVWLDGCEINLTVHGVATANRLPPGPSAPNPPAGEPGPPCTLSPAQVQRLETWAAGFPMVGALQ